MKCFKKTHGNLWILKSNEIIFNGMETENIDAAIPDSAFSMMATQMESFALKMTDIPGVMTRHEVQDKLNICPTTLWHWERKNILCLLN